MCLAIFLAAVASAAAGLFVSGYPMTRVEMAMRNDGRWQWAYRDRRGRMWIAPGAWSLARKEAAFEPAGCWTEAGPWKGKAR